MSAAACAPTPTRLGTPMLTFAAAPAVMPPSAPEPEARGGAKLAPEAPCVHPQLWQACAGSLCAVPPVGAAVYYFPQGHAEQAGAGAAVDLRGARVPPFVPCRVEAVRLMAEPDTDDIFAKIRLVPLRPMEPVADVGDAAALTATSDDGSRDGGQHNHQQHHHQQPRPLSFAKTLTQSDANNGGGFSVPRFCATTIFPELDYTFCPPVQFVSATDVHGVEWTFRHIYRGTPRRHLLTTGWSSFVSTKKLLPGDSVVFVREDDGKVHIGVRRAKRVFCGGGGDGPAAPLSAWDAYGRLVRGNAGCPGAAAAAGPSDGKVPVEDVVKAVRLAAAGQPFEVVHYPRASAPEFFVRAAAVRESMQLPWGPGLRFKMAFETEDLSRISWFMGTIAGVKAADPARWPQSPWRLLQVTWDEPELLRNVNRVCPWQVELVSSMPNLPRFSPPPSKKPRTPPYTQPLPQSQQLFEPAAFPPTTRPLPLAPPHPAAPNHDMNRHGFVPSFPFPDSTAAAVAAAAGIQGARHPQFAPFFPDLLLSSLQQSLLLCGIHPADHRAPPAPWIATDLKIGSATPRSPSPDEAKKGDDVKPPGIMLFGQAILTEQQMKSSDGSGVPTSPPATGSGGSSSKQPDCDGGEKASNTSDRSGSDVTHGSPAKKRPPTWRSWWSDGASSAPEFALELGQCKVFVESDAVGRNLDLSALGSFDELCAHLSGMFGINNDADLRSHMVYRTVAGEVKHVGDEPFSEFVKSARRITILSDAGSDNTGNR